MQDLSLDADEFDSVLGTPSSQKLLRLIISWNSLSLQELVSKSQISKSQVHATLKKLMQHKVLSSPSRGIYTLGSNHFAELLQKAYKVKILEQINAEIYRIQQLLKNKDLEQAERQLDRLVELYGPVLEKSFALQMSSLSHQFIDELSPK